MRTVFIKVSLWFQQIFIYPQKTLNEIGEDYDAYWRQKRGTQPNLSVWQKKRAQLIVQALKRSHEKEFEIIDIGSGDGVILKYILDHFPNARAIGYDSSPVAHELAHKSGIQDTRFLNLKDDIELKSVSESDYTLLLETLEHIPESEKVLRSAYEKSRKGVFFSFPNSGFFTYRLRMLFGKFPAQWIRMPNEHLRFWTYNDAKWWLCAQGYKNARIEVYEGVPLIRKILPGIFGAGIFAFLPKE